MAQCSTFCQPSCQRRHHPILLSLFDAKCKKTLQEFKQTVRAYQLTGYRVDLDIPDPNPTFRYPLLHWAAVLQNIEAIKILLRHPFNVDAQVKSDEGESVLHRILLFWNPINSDFGLVKNVIDVLHECLESVDRKNRTPLHVCAEYLIACSRKDILFWRHILNTMIVHIKGKCKRKAVLNAPSNTGETVLHILSKRSELLETVKGVVKNGSDWTIRNNADETPLEIAWRYALPVYEYLNKKNQLQTLEVSSCHGDRLTRGSLRMSDAIDYTVFFELDQSDSDGDDRGEKCEGNVFVMKKSQKEAPCRKRRKCRIESDSEESDEEEKNLYGVASKQPINENKCTLVTSSQDMEIHKRLEVKLKSQGIELEIRNDQSKADIEDEILETIESIRDMQKTDDTEETFEDQSETDEDEDVTNDNLFASKIQMIQDIIQKMAG